MDAQIEALLQLVPTLADQHVVVLPLSGGITNRNYRLDTGRERYVLRLAGDDTELLGIDRQREFACSTAAAALGVGAEVIAFLPEHGALVTRFVEGKVLEPEHTQQPDVMRRVVDALRRYHQGPPRAGSFSPFDTVRLYHARAAERRVPFPDEMERALSALWRIEEALPIDDPARPCHNDLLPSNFIDDGERVVIIDWDYAGMGDRFFDLGNLAVNHCFQEKHEIQLLELYFGAAEPEQLRRLRLMRLASDMRESLWGFLQAGISTLDFDFLGYGTSHLHRFLAAVDTIDARRMRTTAAS
jgi:thiamine kinase-like enzyme